MMAGHDDGRRTAACGSSAPIGSLNERPGTCLCPIVGRAAIPAGNREDAVKTTGESIRLYETSPNPALSLTKRYLLRCRTVFATPLQSLSRALVAG